MGRRCNFTLDPDLRLCWSLKFLLLFCAACIPAKVMGVVLRLEEVRVGLSGLALTGGHVSYGCGISDLTGVLILVTFFIGVAKALGRVSSPAMGWSSY